MSMLCLLQIVDRISRFAAKMPSMLSCGIRMAGPMSRKTWSAPWWLRSVPGSVSEFCQRFGSLVSPGEPGYSRERGCDEDADPLSPKCGKAPGYDNIHLKFLKIWDQERGNG